MFIFQDFRCFIQWRVLMSNIESFLSLRFILLNSSKCFSRSYYGIGRVVTYISSPWLLFLTVRYKWECDSLKSFLKELLGLISKEIFFGSSICLFKVWQILITFLRLCWKTFFWGGWLLFWNFFLGVSKGGNCISMIDWCKEMKEKSSQKLIKGLFVWQQKNLAHYMQLQV